MRDDLEPLDPSHPETESRRNRDTLDLLSAEDEVIEFRRVKHDFSEILLLLQQSASLNDEDMARRLKVAVDFFKSYFTIGYFTDAELDRLMRAVRNSFPKEQILESVNSFYEQPNRPDPLASVFKLPPEIEAKLSKRPDSRPPRKTALMQYLFPEDEVR